MDKKKVVEEIQGYLAEELAAFLPSVEAGALDEAGQVRVREIQQQLTMYKFLPLREYSANDVVCPSALVELDLRGRHAFYLVVPTGGGLVMKIEGQPVQVITPNSPLGAALMGKRVGESVSLTVQGTTRDYRVVGMQ